MEYELNEKTFFVKEIFSPTLDKEGSYNYFILEKSGLSHKQACKRIPKDACFCGVKDKNATTEQWFSTKRIIEEIDEEKIKVLFKGRSNEKIFIGKHKGNAFLVKVNLSKEEEKELKKINMKKEFVANYFGEQRFDERTSEFSNAIEKNDYEKALKIFLCEPSKFDSEKSTIIKKIVIKNWEQWKKIVQDENLPESKKPLFDFLSRESNFEEAFNFAEKKSLKHAIRACEAKKWNEMLKKEITEKVVNNLDKKRASRAIKQKLLLLPTVFEEKIGGSGIERRSFFSAKKFHLKKKGKENWLSFELPKGSYATIFLEYLKERLKE